ncbi:MAG: PspC domain-containing protein [Rikenellaceae bacterium]|jgi:phage shock protein PspC (stress-responsive transcriptional regulator)|nr:PspC domain-containing protein [Rikenellaceae bacterium]
MKQTYNVNVGGRAYNIDNDAYELLDRYLNDISSRLSDSDMESMEDIEARIADIFDEKITTPMQVVTIEMVRRAMAIIGRPDMFGGQKRGFSYQDPAQPKKLSRSTTNKVFGGVCGGLGKYFDVDATPIRVLAVVLLFLTFFACAVAYVIMWIVIPAEPNYVLNE